MNFIYSSTPPFKIRLCVPSPSSYRFRTDISICLPICRVLICLCVCLLLVHPSICLLGSYSIRCGMLPLHPFVNWETICLSPFIFSQFLSFFLFFSPFFFLSYADDNNVIASSRSGTDSQVPACLHFTPCSHWSSSFNIDHVICAFCRHQDMFQVWYPALLGRRL